MLFDTPKRLQDFSAIFLLGAPVGFTGFAIIQLNCQTESPFNDRSCFDRFPPNVGENATLESQFNIPKSRRD
jgi:hypothetical protein